MSDPDPDPDYEALWDAWAAAEAAACLASSGAEKPVQPPPEGDWEELECKARLEAREREHNHG